MKILFILNNQTYIRTDILSFSANPDKINYAVYEPKRITFELYEDDFIINNIIYNSNDINLVLQNESNTLFTGFIDRYMTRYNAKTGIIKFTAYGYSKKIPELGKKKLPEASMNENFILSEIQLPVNIINNEGNIIINKQNLIVYTYHELLYQPPQNPPEGWENPYTQTYIGFENNELRIIHLTAKTYIDGKYITSAKGIIIKIFNKVCPEITKISINKFKSYDTFSEAKNNLNLLKQSDELKEYFTNTDWINNLSYDNYSYDFETTFPASIISHYLKFSGNIIPNEIDFKETNVTEALKSILYIHGKALKDNSNGDIVINSIQKENNPISIQNDDVIEFSLTFKKPDPPLKLNNIKGDPTILENELALNNNQNMYNLTVDNINKYTLNLFDVISVNNINMKTISLYKNLLNDEYNLITTQSEN